jgi:cytosine/adenosine deaminase-related metal-dependent hydrolase
MPSEWTIRARWILPVDQPPLRDGTVTVAGNRIKSIDPAGARTPDTELGDVAVLPGLVNAHAHLDLGGLADLRQRLSTPPVFTDWLRAVVAYRRSTPPTDWAAAVRAGAEASLQLGTTLVGDIAAGGLSAEFLRDGPLRATVFHEVIGLTKGRARQTWRDAERWLGQWRSSEFVRPGLSPHAPYTVRRGLFRLAAREREHRNLPVAVHVAETPAELELLANHTGELRVFLEELGAWDAAGLAPDLGWMVRQFAGTSQLSCVHANYVDRVAAGGVVWCPRTHAYFGHGPHPFRQFLKDGVTVALGTDSLASNPDLSILEEMRFVHQRHPDLDGAALVRMGTQSGSLLLGWGDEVGTLTPGKFADLVSIPLANTGDADPYLALLQSDAPVRDVCVAGHWLSREGSAMS